MKQSTKKIFLISNESWGDVWYSKHHYAYELAKLGYCVFFVNAPKFWSIKHLFSNKICKKIINDNLYVINYNNPFPLRVLPQFFMAINDLIISLRIKKQFNISGPSIMWTFDPLRFAFFPLSKNIIYHVADPYMSLEVTKKYDPFIAKKANLIVCTSPLYEDYYKKKGHLNTFTIQHKISEEEFYINEDLVTELKNKFGEFILLVGNINKDVSIEILETINNNISNNLLFVGVDENKIIYNRMKVKDRYHDMGPIHGTKIKNYIAAASVCITAYKFDLNKGVGSGSPLKILNYLAQFKPIVTSIDSEIIDLEKKAIYTAKNIDEFIDLIKIGLRNDLIIDRTAIKNYLSQNTYEEAINKILNRFEEK